MCWIVFNWRVNCISFNTLPCIWVIFITSNYIRRKPLFLHHFFSVSFISWNVSLSLSRIVCWIVQITWRFIELSECWFANGSIGCWTRQLFGIDEKSWFLLFDFSYLISLTWATAFLQFERLYFSNLSNCIFSECKWSGWPFRLSYGGRVAKHRIEVKKAVFCESTSQVGFFYGNGDVIGDSNGDCDSNGNSN